MSYFGTFQAFYASILISSAKLFKFLNMKNNKFHREIFSTIASDMRGITKNKHLLRNEERYERTRTSAKFKKIEIKYRMSKGNKKKKNF